MRSTSPSSGSRQPLIAIREHSLDHARTIPTDEHGWVRLLCWLRPGPDRIEPHELSRVRRLVAGPDLLLHRLDPLACEASAMGLVLHTLRCSSRHRRQRGSARPREDRVWPRSSPWQSDRVRRPDRALFRSEGPVVAAAAAINATNGSSIRLYSRGSSPPRGAPEVRETGMWVWSGTKSDSNPRASARWASSPGGIPSSVANIASPCFIGAASPPLQTSPSAPGPRSPTPREVDPELSEACLSNAAISSSHLVRRLAWRDRRWVVD